MGLPHTAVPQHVNDNIDNIAELHHRLNRRVDRHQRAVEKVTHGLGRPVTVYALVASAALWVAYNAAASRIGMGGEWPVFDSPPFFWLQGVLGLYGAIVATMVLTAQIRQQHEAGQRAHLELQVNLLSEQKATKIIALLEELRRDMPNVNNRRDPLAEAMQEEVDPQAVLSALESTIGTGAPSSGRT